MDERGFMKTNSRRSLVASGGLLALAAAAVLATQTGAEAQAAGGDCGAGGGNLCKEVETCIFKDCITVSNYYKAAIEMM